jgi:hypothetical protein
LTLIAVIFPVVIQVVLAIFRTAIPFFGIATELAIPLILRILGLTFSGMVSAMAASTTLMAPPSLTGT